MGGGGVRSIIHHLMHQTALPIYLPLQGVVGCFSSDHLLSGSASPVMFKNVPSVVSVEALS